MVKRRRERDRPKSGPESAYNPNKRILLSYGSDEDEELEAVTQEEATPEDVTSGVNAPADDTISPYPEDDAGESSSEQNGEFEAGLEDAAVKDGSTPQHRKDESLWTRGVRKNQTTGQWAALGSLAYQWEGNDEEGEVVASEEEEAMAYLRAVRSERQNMPEVLTGSRPYSHDEIYDNDIGDTRGFLEDGAYVARASLGPLLPKSAKVTVAPQEAYTKALTKRFLAQRNMLHLSPQEGAVAALDERHPISFPRRNNKAYADWLRFLRTVSPHPDQLRAMDRGTVDHLLELIREHYLVREEDIVPTTSTWIWALLARLDEVGTMNNAQVWKIREFGKKAVLVHVSFDNPAAAKLLEEEAGEDDDDSTVRSPTPSTPGANSPSDSSSIASDEDTSLAATDQKHQDEQIVDEAARQNTLATLDAVIVIVSEMFGQRDLFEFRQPWTGPDDTPV